MYDSYTAVLVHLHDVHNEKFCFTIQWVCLIFWCEFRIYCYFILPQLKLVNPSASRFEHLVTQLKWRLQEGDGEAIYEIGVEDNGLLAGLSEMEMTASLGTLNRMADRLAVLRCKIHEIHSIHTRNLHESCNNKWSQFHCFWRAVVPEIAWVDSLFFSSRLYFFQERF